MQPQPPVLSWPNLPNRYQYLVRAHSQCEPKHNTQHVSSIILIGQKKTPTPQVAVASPQQAPLRDEKGEVITERSLREKLKLLTLERKSIEEEKLEIEKERNRIKKEWEEVEAERRKIKQLTKDEMAKIAEEKAIADLQIKDRIR